MNEQNNYNNIEEVENTEETKPAKKSGFVKDLIKDIIIAIIIVLAITAVIKPTIVKEDSMLDTLQSNNYLFVNKLAYKFKDHPERGDIIVFRSDLINEQDGSKKLLIKRVIGVEGDVISFEDDYVYRNGKLLDEDYLYEEEPAFRNYPNGSEFVVGEDEIFAMGDHRSVSWDSRSEDVGMVPEDKVVGKAFIRLFPFNEIGFL
ncbi:MAG: signal peptidase I [Firmicutes bacterium]|nr:signal peptidase I [Bacillota bacterium]